MAPTVAEITDPHLSVYTRVPDHDDIGICSICHTGVAVGYELCWSCQQTTRQVTDPVRLVVPISLHRSYSQLGKWLRRYKDPDGIPENQQRRFTRIIAATLGRFLTIHSGCIETEVGLGFDTIATVPSTMRDPPHPFDQALELIPWLEPQPRRLLTRGPGVIAHNVASDEGFEVSEDVAGQSVLLVDDTWTTGARVQSAASALQRAGAVVSAAVIVGRVISPDGLVTDDDWWKDLRRTPFTFDTCCLE